MTASRRIICNAGPLIALAKLNRLDLLSKLFGEVEIPQAVYREVVTQGLTHGAADASLVQLFWKHQEWPIVEVSEQLLLDFQPETVLDAGEAEVLALAQEDPSALVLLDDDLARKEARRFGVELKGTLGLLVQAFRKQILTFEEVEFLIQQIAARPDIWIGARICEGVLNGLGGESSLKGF